MMHDYGPVNASWGGHEWWFAHLPIIAAILSPIILFVILWSIVWKGLALWHSARRGQYWWFIIFMFVNTLGILEIVYLFGVAKLKFNQLFSSKEHHNH